MRNRLLILFLLLVHSYSINADQLTVVYPEVKPPYDAIFAQIIEGIESEFQGKITHLKLPSQFNIDETANSITTDKVIALGKRGMRIAQKIHATKQVVVGALPLRPNSISGVSLIASPKVLFDSLNELAPQIKTIQVLYTSSSSWIIDLAKQEASTRGLKFHATLVTDIRNAVSAYSDLFDQENLENTAIWLPLDPVTANEKVIVPVILEKAWEKKMPVFSSKPSHAKRGALFSALPNNEYLGSQLVSLLHSLQTDKTQPKVSPLKSVKLAVNLRTAAHLGFNYSANEKAGFALTFPK